MCIRSSILQGARNMKTKRSTSMVVRIGVIALTLVALATAAPAAASVVYGESSGSTGAKFSSALQPKPAAAEKIARVLIVEAPSSSPASEEAPTSAVSVVQVADPAPSEMTAPTTKAAAPVVAAAPKPAEASGSTTVSRTTAATGELAQAKAILARYIAQYPILQGTTVAIGDTPSGYQAVCYYQSGRIQINTNHTVSLERILAHEIWHVIDWRDNGQIDWGENIPPK